jgi:hypothetical protein
MTCLVQRTEDFGEDLPCEYVENYDSEIDSQDPPECFFKINEVRDQGSPSMDASEPFDASSKRMLHCLPILEDKGSLLGGSYDCLVLEHTEQRGVIQEMWNIISPHRLALY